MSMNCRVDNENVVPISHGFYSAVKKMKFAGKKIKTGRSGKYNIEQGDPCSERQKPHVVFHLWVLVCSVHLYL